MTQIFLRDIAKLHDMIAALGERVQVAVTNAVKAVENRDTALAKQVIEGDRAVDAMEVEIEEECLKILALHQPVAQDLRFIVAVLKMNSDLERIGDKAAGLGKKAIALSELAVPGIAIDHHGMAERALAMLREALDALLNRDPKLAEHVCRSDETINAMEDEHTDLLREFASKQPNHTEACGLLIEVSSALERVADLATNIAEDVIYMVDGSIVRHRVGEL